MAASARHTLLRAAVAVAIASTLAGCAARYDAQGNVIYRWQFLGQDTQRDIDYSTPRLPILPHQRPSNWELWPIPSPYEFNDLSRYSFLQDTTPVPMSTPVARRR